MKKAPVIIILYCVAFFLSSIALAQNDFWEQAGTEALDVEALYIGDNDDIYVATFVEGVYRSTDNGDHWTQINNGITNLIGRAICVGNAGDIYFGSDFGGIFRSTDSGANWTEMNNGLTNLGQNALAVNSAGDIFAGTQAGLFRSTDDGGSWTLVFEGAGSFVRALEIDLGTSSIFAAGSTSNSRIFARSDDNGSTWAFIAGFGPANSSVQALNITRNGDVYAGLNFGGIYRSVDAGENWTEINTGVPAFTEIRSITSDSNGDLYAAVQQRGVLISTNSGAIWTENNSGLHIGPLIGRSQALGVNSKGDIFIGTDLGVFRHKSTSISVEESVNELPLSVSLDQNYPNPFNPVTTIGYEISKPGIVKLGVFDVMGRELETLIDGVAPAGEQKITFDANRYPSGVYLYRLETVSGTLTRSMILLK